MVKESLVIAQEMKIEKWDFAADPEWPSFWTTQNNVIRCYRILTDIRGARESTGMFSTGNVNSCIN